MEQARRLAPAKKRPARTIRCSDCGTERDTYARGGLIVRCPGCGAYYQVPPGSASTQAGAPDNGGDPPAAPAAPAAPLPPEQRIPPPAEPHDPDPPAPVAGAVRVVRAEEIVITPAPAPTRTPTGDAIDQVPTEEPAASGARRLYPKSDPRSRRSR